MPDTSYTGDHEGVHVIKRGETLSSIARRYGFRHWQPIWIYNSKIYPVLKHPDRIPAGGRLLLPRSRTGYEKLITKLKQLRYQIGGKADCVLHELEGSYNRHMAHRVLYDFLGDAATVLVMAGFKAARAARAARAALTTTGRAVPAAKYLARQEAKKMSKYLTSELGEKTGDLAFDALGGNRNPIAKGTYQSYKTVKKGARAIRGVSLQHGRSLPTSVRSCSITQRYRMSPTG